MEQRYDKDNAESKQFWAEFSRDLEKQAKILADRSLCCETKRILDTERPTFLRGVSLNQSRSPLMKFLTLDALHIVCEGTLCPNETHGRLRSFSGPEFEAYLRKTAEEIIDRAVRMVIEDVDRIVFEE